MLTDWVLIGRLARELETRLRGGRVQDVGLSDDGAIALIFRRDGKRRAMLIDLFSSPPLVTLEEGELAVVEEAGFVRALARSLNGMVLTGAASRRLDRLIRLRFASRSRFGVGDEVDLYIELVPRFGNVVLVKDESIVAARKEFGTAENPRRAIQAGSGYALPPLPAKPRTLGPLDERDGIPSEPLYVYRRDGRLVQAYVRPLEELAGAELTRESSLLDVFAALRAEQTGLADDERNRRRRDVLLRRLGERESKLRRELAALDAKRRAAGAREELRATGEAIFATLHGLDESEREAAKERAGKLFAEYKKLGKSLPHIARRERAIDAALEAVETLRWECERAAGEDIRDVETAIDALANRRATEKGSVPRKRKRRMLELRTASGSRIAVGRSPIENAELTFHVARPNDLWFHAQGVPGAHVILSRDDRAHIPNEDLEAAAALAAFYSKARAATSAPVDYTLRKHVRKQRAAPPGLVWYTHAKTILAQPQSVDSLEQR